MQITIDTLHSNPTPLGLTCLSANDLLQRLSRNDKCFKWTCLATKQNQFLWKSKMNKKATLLDRWLEAGSNCSKTEDSVTARSSDACNDNITENIPQAEPFQKPKGNYFGGKKSLLLTLSTRGDFSLCWHIEFTF